MTALAMAAKFGYLDAAKLLVSAGCDVNKRNLVLGCTPLMQAVCGSHLSVVEFLLKEGGGVNAKDHSGRTPLILAADSGRVTLVQTLLKNGARLDARTSFEPVPVSVVDSMNVCGLTNEDIEKCKEPFQGNDAFLTACLKNNTKVVQELLKHGTDVHSKNACNSCALHIAARGGFYELALILLEENVDPDIQNVFGETPLQVACKSLFNCIVIQSTVSIMDIENIAKVAELLIKSGCDVTVADSHQQGALNILLKGSFSISGPNSRLGRLRFRLVQLILSATASCNVGDLPGSGELSPDLTEEHSDILEWLRSFLKSPRSLRHLARTTIRTAIGAQRFSHVGLLGLNSDVERYIML